MKKLLAATLSALLLFSLMIPATAALVMEDGSIENAFDKLPDLYKNAEEVALYDYFEEGATNARGSQGDQFDYVFLKQDDLGDFVVPFDVKEEGLYHFAFKLMGWQKSVLRSTNIRIDDGPNIYIGYDYEDEDQYKEHFFYGISAILQPGEHTVTLSLAPDFDDTTVKSLYFDTFYYAYEELPEEVPAEPAADVPTADAPVAPAPATADTFVFALTGLAAAAAAAVVLSKRK